MSMTVNAYGQWTPLNSVEEYENMPKSEWCDMDWIAYAVLKRPEPIETDISNISYLVCATIEDFGYNVFKSDKDRKKDMTFDQKINTIIDEHGGIGAFDFYC